jgi:hypothetical protein
MIDWSHLFGIKYFVSIVGGALVMLGSGIEPSVGIWVVSLGGSLLTVSLGQDQSIFNIFINVMIGLFFGIFGSQIIHTWEPLMPQIAASFFLSMFGVNITQYMIRNLRTNTFSEIVATIIDRIIPWKKEKEKGGTRG